MEIGVFTVLFSERELGEALDYVVESGVAAVEIGAGAYPGKAHCDPAELLEDRSRREAFKRAIRERDLTLSALSCHGNPLHPQEEIADTHIEDFRNTVRLASELEVDRVITFSGCPGDHEGAKHPNWVTCPWPPDFLEVLEWQWKEKVIPYWQQEVEFCRKHGVEKVALEMHPGFVVYNPETNLKLREAVGDVIGCNFDPSHLFWQGIDPAAAIRILGDAIYHVHGKDTKIDGWNTRVNGVLDAKPYSDESNRSWLFRTIGYGNGLEMWKEIVSTLRLVGYDGVISIEHEDSLMSVDEGFTKAVSLLQEAVIAERPGEMWWA